METLTHEEARKLLNCLYVCECALSDEMTRNNTNAQEVYNKIWEAIYLHTNRFLLLSVYNIPGIMPPIE